MLKIYYTVEEVFKQKFKKSNPQFKKGFLACLMLFDIGFKKREDYNLHIKIRELEQENKKLKKIVEKKYSRLKQLEIDLGSTSLISGIPTVYYREILIETAVGTFTIVTNMDSETINACVLDFATKRTFRGIDDGKNKLLQFINSKSEYGFKAFKNIDTAIKEGVQML